jgi:hypothetical protein
MPHEECYPVDIRGFSVAATVKFIAFIGVLTVVRVGNIGEEVPNGIAGARCTL